jgi:hypothetical protein
MERIQVLIDKLQQQHLQNENPASMLVTIQLLQNELITLQKGNKVLGTSKVSVVMPNVSAYNASLRGIQDIPYKKEEIAKPIPSETKQEPAVTETPKKEYVPQKPAVIEKAEAKTATVQAPLFSNYHDSFEEAPTLLQQQSYKEVHELIAGQNESLNDKLKQEKREVAHAIKESPVKDLRKAIGVNDKFVFISELFRGDEAMYERSIKTINTFHILPEAEYWINRELKVKLGWNDSQEVVQHFYQLVRRRFS